MIVGDFTSWEESDGNKTQASSPADWRRWQSHGDKEARRKEEVWIGGPTPGTSAMSWGEINRVEEIRSLAKQSYIQPVIFQSLLDGGKDIVLISLPIFLILVQLLRFRCQTPLLVLFLHGMRLIFVHNELDIGPWTVDRGSFGG